MSKAQTKNRFDLTFEEASLLQQGLAGYALPTPSRVGVAWDRKKGGFFNLSTGKKAFELSIPSGGPFDHRPQRLSRLFKTLDADPGAMFRFVQEHGRPTAARYHGCSSPTGEAIIYGLRARNGQCFYVGSTIHKLNHRLQQHLRAPSKRVGARFDDVGRANVEIFPIEVVDESERGEREYNVIARYLREGLPLLNFILSEP